MFKQIFSKKGFSMIELLVVVGMAALIFFLSAPFSLNFYRTQQIEEVRSNIIDALQRARHYAVLQKNDSDFGVTLSEVADNYVIFQGDTYGNEPDFDEIFPVISDISIDTGLTDVVFNKLTGIPSATGTITLVYGNLTRTIVIDDNGGVSVSGSGDDEEESCEDFDMVSSDLTDGVVAYWPLDCDARDYSGNGNNAVDIVGNVTGITGKVGDAYDFGGDTDYIEIPHSAELSSQTFSVSTWVKIANASGSGIIFAKGWGDAHNAEIEFGYRIWIGTKFDGVFSDDDDSYKYLNDTGSALSSATWYHVTVTFDGSNYRMYRNGSQTAITPNAELRYNGTQQIILGGRFHNDEWNGYAFDGVIDEVTMWNRAITADEVSELYAGGAGLSLLE